MVLMRDELNVFFVVGLMHDDLRAFLTDQLPKGQSVGINDSRLLQVVKEELGVPVAGGDIVSEICRGVRVNIDQLIKQLELKKVIYVTYIFWYFLFISYNMYKKYQNMFDK